MAKDGIFFRYFGELNKMRRTPASSIFLQTGIAVILVITASFNALLIYIGFTLSFFAMLTVTGMMKIRKTQAEHNNIYKTLGYPITPMIFILGNLWIIFFSIKSRPIASLFGMGTIGVGILFYFYFSIKAKTL